MLALECRQDPNPYGCRPTRTERRTTGFDDMLELLGTEQSSTGLRVPELPGVMYRFLCQKQELAPGMSLVGLRQFLTMAALIGTGDGGSLPPFYLDEFTLTSENWRFQDSYPPVWTLTRETKTNRPRILGPHDQQSFAFLDTDGSALVYQTAGFPTFPPPGAGYLGLNAYAAPPMIGQVIRVLKDIPFRWQDNDFLALGYCAEQPETWRLYCDILQTNPATRRTRTITTLSTQQAYPVKGERPEELYLQIYPTLAAFYRVAAAFIVDGGHP